jgi:hypothetical protein
VRVHAGSHRPMRTASEARNGVQMQSNQLIQQLEARIEQLERAQIVYTVNNALTLWNVDGRISRTLGWSNSRTEVLP